MKISHFRPSRLPILGFTLLELLVVIGIIALLSSLAGPAISSISKGSQMNQALAEVGGLLEQARQYAVAKNTYVWVAFDDSRSGEEDQLRIAVLASKGGTDLAAWGTDDTTGAAAQTQVLNRIRTFSQVKLSGADTFGAGEIADLPPAANSGDLGDAVFTIRLPGGGQGRFSKAIQFTPAGEARNGATLIGVIDFGLQPSRGRAVVAKNGAVVRVNGLTGQHSIFRP